MELMKGKKLLKSQHTGAFSLGAKCHINLTRSEEHYSIYNNLVLVCKFLISFLIFYNDNSSSGKNKLCSKYSQKKDKCDDFRNIP